MNVPQFVDKEVVVQPVDKEVLDGEGSNEEDAFKRLGGLDLDFEGAVVESACRNRIGEGDPAVCELAVGEVNGGKEAEGRMRSDQDVAALVHLVEINQLDVQVGPEGISGEVGQLYRGPIGKGEGEGLKDNGLFDQVGHSWICF